jgi:uncharacterized protein YijF (DUF1287 family)
LGQTGLTIERAERRPSLMQSGPLLASCLLLASSALLSQTATDTPVDPLRTLLEAAHERTTREVRYDGRYLQIGYPNGDVPDDIGVCTDLVIRSYRALGLDLQRLVHEDMRAHFDAYPPLWGLSRPDRSIDHRRVPNLETYFRRHGQVLPVSDVGTDYRPGDLVTWRLPGNLPHIGIVSDQLSEDGLRPLIYHNIGAGPKLEDMLFDYPVHARFRFGVPAREDHMQRAQGSGPRAQGPVGAPRELEPAAMS